MNFLIEYGNQPEKFLSRQDAHIARRIVDKIEEDLPDNPVPHNAVSLEEHSCFRIRIGDYRVLYRVNYSENKIVIFKIDKRSRAYD